MNSNFIDPFIPNENNNQKTTNLIKAMDFDVRTKSIEEKIYIILYKINNDDSEEIYNNIYSICIGRTEAFTDIKEKIISGLNIDVHRSKIITETKQTESGSGDRKYYLLPYDECISIYSFCLSVKEYYSNEEFDIEDYNNSDIPDDPIEELSKNPRFMTAEQQEYKKMLEASMKRDKFLNALSNELNATNI